MSTQGSITALRANPTTPPFSDDQQWITAYMTIHMMSAPSYRVAYLLWFFVAFVFLVTSCAHQFAFRRNFLGAHWSKLTLRRITWRKDRSFRQEGHVRPRPLLLPSNTQLLSILCLFAVALVLSFVGPDYVAPQVGLFSFVNNSPVANVKRAYDSSQFFQYQPQYTIPKAWWTVGGRTGIITFALLPLCIIFALKSPPFALFSIPFTTQLHFDKLTYAHRWSGRLIWLVAAFHVAAWSVQLAKDSRSTTHTSAYTYAWHYPKFIYGWVAFGLLTLIISLSIRPIRHSHYETFYFLHVLFIPLMLVTSALHHPPLQSWAYAALGIWICERLWRVTWWLHINGYYGGITTTQVPKTDPIRVQHHKYEAMEMKGLNLSFVPRHLPASSQSTSATLVNKISTVEELVSPPSTYLPPPGYAHAELLPGRTVRIKFVTPGYRPWSPGQHFLLSIPCVSKFKSHPFTTASICDEQSTADAGRALIFVIRSRTGWTKDLWDTVVNLTARGLYKPPGENLPRGSRLPSQGVVMRVLVDGPFGSVARTHWNSHSTVVIVAGGSGVSFGLSILEYLCLCLRGRHGTYLGGAHRVLGHSEFSVTRVRLIWLVREFGHIQWCASILRRCMASIAPPLLQVDIFVTNAAPSPALINRASMFQSQAMVQSQEAGESNASEVSKKSSSLDYPNDDEDEEYDDLIDLSYYTNDNLREADGEMVGGWEEEVDLTNFRGDDDTELPGEAQLSYRLRKEGILRRAKTRRRTMVGLEGRRNMTADSTDHGPDSSYLQGQEMLSIPQMVNFRSPSETGHKHSSRLLSHGKEIDISTVPMFSPWLSSPVSPTGPSFAAGSSLSNPDGLESPKSVDIRASLSFDPRSDASDVASLMRQKGIGARGEEVKLTFDPMEIHDVAAVAEYARPGRPKLDRLLADEVDKSKGSIIVACCGPTLLNAVMRKHVATQINPARVRRGDLRGSITIVLEDFEY